MAFVRSLLAVLACSLALLASASSFAADSAQARAAFAEGQKQFAAGNIRGALVWFENGYLQSKDPAFLLNIGQCHRSLGEVHDALKMFKLYLESSPVAADPQAHAIASKAIEELESAAKAAPPHATTAAASNGPASASAGSATSALPPGALPASNSTRRFQSGSGGMPVLEPSPELDATTKRDAAELAAAAPDTTAATQHKLRVAAMVSGAVGVVATATGVYYWLHARSLADSANRTTTYKQATYDDGKSAEKMQWIFYGVGAAAAATGIGLYLYSRSYEAPRKEHVSLAPMAAPGAAGLAAVGSF